MVSTALVAPPQRPPNAMIVCGRAIFMLVICTSPAIAQGLSERALQQAESERIASAQRRGLYDLQVKQCQGGTRSACDAALASSIATAPDRALLIEWRDTIDNSTRARIKGPPSLVPKSSTNTKQPRWLEVEWLRSTELIIVAMIIAGTFYVFGQWAKGKIDRDSWPKRVAIGVAVAVISGAILRLLDISSNGASIVHITIAGIFVIAVSLLS